MISASSMALTSKTTARSSNIGTLVGRAKGRRFLCVAGEQRLRFDADPAAVVAEGKERKGAADED